MVNFHAFKLLTFAAVVAAFCVLAPASPRAEEEPAQVTEPEKELSRDERLKALFAELKSADSVRTAKKAAAKITKIWARSGSATIDLLMNNALKAVHKKDYALALDLLDAVIRLKPDFAEGWNKRATVYYLQKDYGRSIADIHETLRREPRHFGAINGLAVIFDQVDDDSRSLAAYRMILELYPLHQGAKKAVEKLTGKTEGREI